jgi:peptidoglycan hydrolase FlgJ
MGAGPVANPAGPGTGPVATDFGAFAALREKARGDDPAALRAAAQQFEALFTQMLLKSMREASFGDDLFSSSQGDFYRDLFDRQVALSMSAGKGLGLADVLVRQLAPAATPKKGTDTFSPAAPKKGTDTFFPAEKVPEKVSVPFFGGEPVVGRAAAPGDPIDRFIQRVLPHAQRAGAALGIAPHMLIAQSALETGWGASVAAGSNNLFGIKAGASWDGARTVVATREYADGVAYSERAAFRAYASVAESFDDYARLIGTAPRYAAVREAGADSGRFAGGLQQAGYATDPAYADKIRRIADDPAFRERVQRATLGAGLEA